MKSKIQGYAVELLVKPERNAVLLFIHNIRHRCASNHLFTAEHHPLVDGSINYTLCNNVDVLGRTFDGVSPIYFYSGLMLSLCFNCLSITLIKLKKRIYY